MRWCLTEAMQDQHRAAARQSSSVVLIRDERRGKMMVRFRLRESKTLNVRSGVLALEKLSCGQAEEILRATPYPVLPKSPQSSTGVPWARPGLRRGVVQEVAAELPNGGNGLRFL